MKLEYGLLKIDENEYWFNYDIDYTKVDLTNLKYKFATNIQINKEKGEIVVSITVYISSPNGDVDYMRNGARAVFGIKPFNEIIQAVDNDKFNVNVPNLIETFVSITLGAIRGLMIKNLKNTPLDSLILPLISMDEIKKIVKKQ